MTQPTALQIEEYYRKPFVVKAVEVTAENMEQVAKWCKGEVRTAVEEEGSTSTVRYIKVDVKRPLNEKQTQAYVGDMVLRAGSGFKVYTPKAFNQAFDKKVKDMMKVVGNMITREVEEDRVEDDQVDSTTPDSLPVGGINTSFVSPR